MRVLMVHDQPAANDKFLELPAVNTGAVVTTGGTQTLTNKTHTNPTIHAAGGVIVVPTSATPAQTAEGSLVWDSDDDVLTVGDGTGRKTLVDLAGVQTLANKTHTAPILNAPVINLAVAALAGLGTVQGDAAPIVTGSGAFIHATGANGTVGIRLPAAVAGLVYEIKNSDAANAVLKVYPATGDAINAIAANGSYDMAAKSAARFIALDATTWITIPLVAS